MHRRYSRLAYLRVLLSFLILVGPALRPSPAMGSTFAGSASAAPSAGRIATGVSVASNTGDATYAMEIVVPPGTAGLQPTLSLSYNSGATVASWAGHGWDVSVPSVRRTLRNGIPLYSNSYNGVGDTFEFSGEPLAFLGITGGDSRYKTVRESPLDIRHNNGTNTWTVVRPDGRKLVLGATSASRVVPPQGGVDPLEWLLEYEEDTVGNRIHYSYFQEAGVAYLSEVSYGLGTRRVVRFDLEPRSDTPVSYLAGFPQQILWRLNHVTAQTVSGLLSTGSPDIIRRYDLEYVDVGGAGSQDDLYESPDSYRTLLRAVTLRGVGAAGGLTTKFSYQSNVVSGTTGFAAPVTWPIIGGSITLNDSVRIADINGDGLADIYQADDVNRKIFLNTGACFTTKRTCSSSAAAHGYPLPKWSNGNAVKFASGQGGCSNCTQVPTGTELVDLNRDGRADVVSRHLRLVAPYAFTFTNVPAWIRSTAGGWQNNIPRIADSHLAFHSQHTTGATNSGPSLIADFDGDGAPDIYTAGDVTFRNTTSCVEQRRSSYLYWNNGDMTFSLAPYADASPPPGCPAGTNRLGSQYKFTTTPYSPSAVFLDQNVSSGVWTVYGSPFIGDLNGDGLADAQGTHAEINRGDGTFATDDGFTGTSGQAIDVNGDGLTDRRTPGFFSIPGVVVLFRGYSTGGAGSAYYTAPAWSNPAGGALIDVNGDGLADWTDGAQVRLNNGKMADLLSTVETPYGGRTTISWTTSATAVDASTSAFPNSDASNVGFMQNLKPVVRAIEIDDAKGHVSRTEYGYTRGVFDSNAREFLGFEQVRKIIGRSNGAGGFASQEARVDARYWQTVSLAGLPFETTTYQARLQSGTWSYDPRQTTLLTYGTGAAARLPVRLMERRSEGVATTTFQRTCTMYSYDSNGNRIQTNHLGLVTNDACTDDTTDVTRALTISYATGAGVRNAWSRITLRSGVNGSIVSDTKLYYDGQPHGTVTAGLLTHQELLNASGTVLAATTIQYDGGTGRVVSITKPRENAGAIAPGDGTDLIAYDPSLPDFVGETRSRPILQGNRLLATTSYVTDTSTCSVVIPPLAGLPAVVVDANGVRTTLCYDAFGRNTSRSIRSGTTEVARTTAAYVDDRVTATTAPSVTQSVYLDSENSRTSTASLDGFGRTVLESVSGPNGTTVQRSVAYDALGRVAQISLPGVGAPGPYAAEFAYDGLGRLISRKTPHSQAPGGYVTTSQGFAIDAGRVRVDIVDPEGHTIRQFAGGFDNTVQVDEMTAGTPTSTTYSYDAAGQITQVRDANGNIIGFAYDSLGRRIQITDPDVGMWTYGYDANGNLTLQDGPRTNPLNPNADPDRLTWEYDNLDRPTRMTRADTESFKSWEYDLAPVNGLGRFYRERENNEGSGVLAYDALGRPTAELAVAVGKQFNFYTTYDWAGDPLTRTYPTGRIVSNDRDARGFLTGISSGSDTYAANISWHHSLQLAGWSAGNGLVTSYGYDPATMLPASFNTGSVESITAYTYAPDYRIASTAGTTTSSFTYDARGRLTSASGPYGSGYAQTTLHYGYDAIGNLTCLDASAAPSGTSCTAGTYFTYPAASPSSPPARPHGATQARLGGATGTLLYSLSYDGAGNVLAANNRAYTYDAEGHVASIATAGTTLSASYNGSGTAWKIEVGANTRYRIYPDFEWTTANLARTSVFLDGRVIAITEESFAPTSYGGCGHVWPPSVPQPAGGEVALVLLYALAGALTFPMARRIRRYRPRGAGSWTSVGTGAAFLVFVSVPPQLVSEEAAAAAPANTTFFHGDRLGSSLVVSDTSIGGNPRRVVYRPFGAMVPSAGATVPERGFTGQRFEASVGVYDYGARWYDPGMARFVQPDPLFAPHDPRTLNAYAYAQHDPTNRVDPTGMQSAPEVPSVAPITAGDMPTDLSGVENITITGTRGPSYGTSVGPISYISPGGFGGGLPLNPVASFGGGSLLFNYLGVIDGVDTYQVVGRRNERQDSSQDPDAIVLANLRYSIANPLGLSMAVGGNHGASRSRVRPVVGFRQNQSLIRIEGGVGLAGTASLNTNGNLQLGVGVGLGATVQTVPGLSAGLQDGEGSPVAVVARGTLGLEWFGVSGQTQYGSNGWASQATVSGPTTGASGFVGVVVNVPVSAAGQAMGGYAHPVVFGYPIN